LIFDGGKVVRELEVERVLINYGVIQEDGTLPKETREGYFSRKTPLKSLLDFIVT